MHIYSCQELIVHTMQDRYTVGRSSPPVDEEQNWNLISGEEDGDFTILEFSRKYITCDEFDRAISVSIYIPQ